jgi:hypothetical protein
VHTPVHTPNLVYGGNGASGEAPARFGSVGRPLAEALPA